MEYKKIHSLRMIPLFNDLHKDCLEKIESSVVIKKFKRNEVILDEQDTGKFFYIIIKGVVRVVKLLEDGRERILTLQGKGDFFGEMAIIDGRTSPARMVAQECSEILFISKEDFLRIIFHDRKVNKRFIEILCDRLRESWAQIKTLTTLTAEAKISKILYDISSRHGEEIDRVTRITIPMSHKAIADMAATSRETVTRTLADLENRGIINRGNKQYIEILDKQKLRDVFE